MTAPAAPVTPPVAAAATPPAPSPLAALGLPPDATWRRWARLEGGAIVELVDLPPDVMPGRDLFHPSLTWADVTGVPGVAAGMVARAGGGYAAAPAAVAPVADLLDYLESYELSWLATPTSFDVGDAGAPLAVAANAKDRTVNDLMRLRDWGLANPTATQEWTAHDWTETTLTGVQFVRLANAVFAWDGACHACLARAARQVRAGALTSHDAIASLPWPRG